MEIRGGFYLTVPPQPHTLARATHTPLQFGAENVGHLLPPFITATIRKVVYGMLAHPQLSIRDHAIRAFSAYLFRSEFQARCAGTVTLNVTRVQEALSAFNEAVNQLRGADSWSSSSIVMFIDAYLAEGLLGVCLFIVKVATCLPCPRR